MCKSSDHLDFSLQSEREDQMGCGQQKQQLLGLHWRRWSQCKETEDWGRHCRRYASFFFQSEYIHAFSLKIWDVGIDLLVSTYLTTILHHFGCLSIPEFCSFPLHLWTHLWFCDVGPVDFGFCCLCCRWEKMKVVAEKNRRERKTWRRGWFISDMLALFFGLTNSSSLAESLTSVFAGTIMLSDFGCCMYCVYIYIYMLMQTILVVWCS